MNKVFIEQGDMNYEWWDSKGVTQHDTFYRLKITYDEQIIHS